jgi:two-component system NtrC family sensor kinase
MAAAESVPRSQESVCVDGLLSVLVVEDETADFNAVVQGLERSGIQARCRLVDNEEDYRAELQTRPDIILSDYVLPAFSALDALQLLQESGLDIPLIVLTGMVSEEIAVESMKRGAADYLLKDRMKQLGSAVRRALAERELRTEKRLAEANAIRERTLKEAAEARAAMAAELERANRQLQETQSQLIHNEKMVSLGQLVAGIAHELNNPVAFVLNNLFLVEGGLEALGSEIQQRLPEPSFAKLAKLRARLGEMKEGLDRVNELVLELRTFSRLDEGQLKTLDIAEAIDAVLLLLKHKMNGRIRVEKEYAPLRTLYCYSGRIHQVLMNLIANAIDAIVGKGTITIATSSTPRDFVISVRDTGMGIPEANRGKIFDPFFTTKPVGQGTGLGLAISYGIVRDHGGSIEVHSTEGVGTEFIVKIPLNLELPRGQ